MAALKIGFTMNEWCGFSVLPYAFRNDAESSSDTVARFCVSAMAVKSRPLEVGRCVSLCLVTFAADKGREVARTAQARLIPQSRCASLS